MKYFFLGLLIISGPAHGYQIASNVMDASRPPAEIRFKQWTQLPIKLRLDGGSFGSNVSGQDFVKSAIKPWNDVPQAQKVFDEALIQADEDFTLGNLGRAYGSSFVTNAPSDGIVDVVFDEDGSIMQSLFGDVESVLGVGISLYDPNSGVILDAVLIINGSVPSNPQADQLATAVHELGHILGLAHTTVGAQNESLYESVNLVPLGLEAMSASAVPTMWFTSIYPDDRFGQSLELDDMLGLIALYPEEE